MVETPEATIPRVRQFISPENRTTLIGVVLYLAFYTGMVLFNTFPPKLPPALWAILVPLSTVLYLFFLTYALRLFCRLSIRLGQETLLMLCALLLFLILNPMVRDIAWKLLTGRSWQQILSQLTLNDSEDKSFVGITLQILVPFFLILTGAFFGQIIARLIRERALLVPVGIIAGLVDFWGIFWGPVGNWSVSSPAAVSQMASAASAAVAVPHNVVLPPQLAVFSHLSPPAFIGIGDFVFLALFLTCAYRLGFSPKRTMWGIFFGLLCSSVALAVSGETICGITLRFEYLPGLVFISGGVLLANIGSWQLSRQEWGMTLGLVAIFLALIGYSAYSIEQSKPHVQQQSLTITAPSGRTAIEQLSLRLRAKLKPGTELVPVEIRALYTNQPPTPAYITQWKLTAVERRAKANIRDLREFLAVAKWDKKSANWQVRVLTQSPPDASLQLLAWLNKKRADALTLLNSTPGVAATAFPLLDLQGHAFKQQRLPALFMLRLCPGYGEFISQNGSIKKLSYAAP